MTATIVTLAAAAQDDAVEWILIGAGFIVVAGLLALLAGALGRAR